MYLTKSAYRNITDFRSCTQSGFIVIISILKLLVQHFIFVKTHSKFFEKLKFVWKTSLTYTYHIFKVKCRWSINVITYLHYTSISTICAANIAKYRKVEHCPSIHVDGVEKPQIVSWKLLIAPLNEGGWYETTVCIR